MGTISKRREEAPAQRGQPSRPNEQEVWLSGAQVGGVLRLKKSARIRAFRDWLSGKPRHDETPKVRVVPGRGGSNGMRYEALLSSFSPAFQAKWRRQQPGADLSAQVAEYAALIEEERLAGARKNRRRFLNRPWTKEEHEAGWAAFVRSPTSVQREARRRLEAVLFFHSLAGTDTPMMERYALVAKRAGQSPDTIRWWVGVCHNLDRGDWVVALAPKHKGRLVRAPITPEAYDFIYDEYFKLSKPALKPIYYRAVGMASERGWTLPDYATLKRLIKSEPYGVRVLLREGEEAASRLFPPQERDYSTLKLHEMWCADGRKADVFVRWEDGSISRPIVVAWLELRSRVCAGYAIGKTESADLGRLSFKDAVEKTRALPEAALLDNGMGFASKLLTGTAPTRYRYRVQEEEIPGILPLMGIKVTWALPYNGRAKPIESWWRTLAQLDKQFPGAYCGNRPNARPEDCDPKKAIPIAQYRQALERTLKEYHEREHRGNAMDGRSPREVYEALLPQTAVRQPTSEQLRLCMQAAELVKLDRLDGSVRVHENRYWCEKTAGIERGVSYVARYNPENAAEPVALYQGETFICHVPLVEAVGFRDQQSAKDHARAQQQFKKSVKQQAAARRDMSKARAWTAAPDVPDALQAEVARALLPTPKVVTPLRPERDYRPPKNEEPIISREDFMEIILNHQQNRASGE